MSRAGLLLALTLAACGAAQPSPERGPAATDFRYTFSVDPSLTRLEGRVCFRGDVPWKLVPIDRSGARYLRTARGPDDVLLPMSERSVDLRGLPPGSCVRYVVDLDAAARQRGGISGAYRIRDDLVASTAVWLWAPSHRDDHARVRAELELPDGISMSPLWTEGPGGYVLDERAFRFTAYAAFGRLSTRSIPVPGACMRLTVLGNGVGMGDDALARSFAGSARAAAMGFGRFPVPEVAVLAVPTPFSSSSPFGVVGRGTLPTVAILVGERATEERLSAAWVPVHEFSHLATPYIDREDAWLAEGVATYYQEVLRARAGVLTEAEAWYHLEDGFRRGEAAGTGRSLSRESRDMMETAAFRRVYWAGAAIALIADVELRRRSDSERGLDHALERLSRCCATWDRAMSAREAIDHLGGDGPEVLRRVSDRWLGDDRFPDLGPTYARLGLRRTATGLEVIDEDDLEAAALRAAIMGARHGLDAHPDCE